MAGNQSYGRPSEAHEVVGVISLHGTLFLLIFAGFFAIPFGLANSVLRPVFPGNPGWRKGSRYGLLLFSIFGSVIVDGDNFDFRFFVSPIIAVVLFAALFPLFGITVSWSTEFIAPECRVGA